MWKVSYRFGFFFASSLVIVLVPVRALFSFHTLASVATLVSRWWLVARSVG